MDYQQLRAGADQEAREDYDFDPRVAFHATSVNQTEVVPHSRTLHVPTTGGQATIEELNHPRHQDTLTLPVQSAPSMVPRTRNIIIDSARRDWTVQPDAYSNIFSFGTQAPSQSGGPQAPFYFNNPTIPFAAWESPILPVRVGSGALSVTQQTPNTHPQSFPYGVALPSYLSRVNQGLVRPTYGWKIVLSNGNPVHSPTPVVYTDPATKVYFYPTYDPAEPAGAQVGIDIQPKQYGTNSYTYSTQLALSNVSEIKLSRAILPVRATQPYLPTTFSSMIDYPLSFHSQPYILMTIQNLKGAYLGGSQIAKQSFTVLTQNTRNLYEGTGNYPSQYSDYYSWSNESYTFDPPMGKLSNANIQIWNPAGDVFSHLDNLSIVDFAIDTVNIGKVKFFVTQTTTNLSFGDCNAFLTTDIRIGDEIAFYGPALAQASSDPSCGKLSSFFNLMSNNFLVTDVCGKDFVVPNTSPLFSVGTSFTAVPKVSGFAGMSNTVVTLCSLLQTVSRVCLQQYPTAPAGVPFANRRTLTSDYAIPMMNLNAQTTFVLEVTTMEPDTTNIQKIIPN
jgi:hypothetical protein